MNLSKHIRDIHSVLISDETLLRLLFYKAKNMNEDITLEQVRLNILGSVTPLKSGVAGTKEMIAAEIISDVLRSSPVAKDLKSDNVKCRICYYFTDLEKVNSASGIVDYTKANQHIVFNIYTHVEYDMTDFRLSLIKDRISVLFHNQNVTGMSPMHFEGGSRLDEELEEDHDGYVGYQMRYRFLLAT